MNTTTSHGHRKAADTAFERGLLRRLPFVFFGGCAIASLPPLLARAMAWAGLGADPTASITTADIFGISVALLTWTTVGTLAIACGILLIMKGPAYFADSYPLDDADRPDPPKQD
ncbi:hypothetical protein [Azoarcus sp. KH32C]|uniref:hypothetical protein n=1 Tax=Azoarcus sp. KH32C TaxID=748247 RepID=UPI0002386593|nr:hypothetical protein [Azoarcus sp. KH32C]BAL22574.1 hypothetical protein AZKH_0228 [Azoarcus sp. KH32C]